MSWTINKTGAWGGALLFAWGALAALSQAQYPGARFGSTFGTPTSPPVISPYLNLLNAGDPAINYFGLVRPQFAYNRAIGNLGNEVNYLESAPGANGAGQQPTFQTGNRSTFMTQYRYFMTNGTAGGSRGGYRPNNFSTFGAGGGGSTYGGASRYGGGSTSGGISQVPGVSMPFGR